MSDYVFDDGYDYDDLPDYYNEDDANDPYDGYA